MRTTSLVLVSLASFAGGCGGGLPIDNSQAGTPDLSMTGSNNQAERTLSLPTFTLGPGEEKTLCAYVPAEGKERWVNRFITDMAPGSHHLVVLRTTTGGDTAHGPEPCSTGIPEGMLPGAQEPHTDLALPDGIAMKLDANEGLYFQMHYINATGTETITAKVTYTMKSVPAEAVKQPAGELFYSMWSLNVPTGPSVQAMTCKAPQDMNLLTATGHMHKHATAFDASISGTMLYHTDNWDSPKWSAFDVPGFTVKQGDPIKWACTYDNQTGGALHFGDSASTNEMCILVGIYYPAPSGQTLFFCNK